ncbi:hypothetical protein F5Y16DRAFT_395913 [Xylariaceae sp. FL0255]|nr:hypothetical protein F5Y16DRAFT_395913 [Xylariaceae sp. FL0255]
MATPDPALPSNPPLSPWATRFGLYEAGSLFERGDNTTHSGYAPLQPSLHPKYYADVPLPKNSEIPRPTDEELGHLFISERWQNKKFHGHLTRQHGVFRNQILRLGGVVSAPGDLASDPTRLVPDEGGDNSLDILGEQFETQFASKIFQQQALQVDESRWYSFLQRSRWYNTPDYSMDDDANWNRIKPAIELVYRILKAAIEDQHKE